MPSPTVLGGLTRVVCLANLWDCYSSKKDLSGNNAELFLEIGGWKTRLSGRELKFSEDERFILEDQHGIHYL